MLNQLAALCGEDDRNLYSARKNYNLTAMSAHIMKENSVWADEHTEEYSAVMCTKGCIEFMLADGHTEIVAAGEMLITAPKLKLKLITVSVAPCFIWAAEYTKDKSNDDNVYSRLFDNAVNNENGCLRILDNKWYESVLYGTESLDKESAAQYFVLRLMEKLMLSAGDKGEKENPSGAYSVESVYRVKEYIDENPEKNLTIGELSERFKMSPTYLKSSFKTAYGRAVHGYIQESRLIRAAKLLETTDKSVLDVASSVGYSGTSRFNEAFKLRFGVTPTQYRKTERKKSEIG